MRPRLSLLILALALLLDSGSSVAAPTSPSLLPLGEIGDGNLNCLWIFIAFLAVIGLLLFFAFIREYIVERDNPTANFLLEVWDFFDDLRERYF
jgi:hypothetical protein